MVHRTSVTGSVSLVLALASALLLGGCGVNSVFPDTTTPGEAVAFGGSVYGGSQPISYTHIHVMQSVNTGFGNASQSLLYSGTTAPSTCGVSGTSLCTDTIGNYVQSTTTGSFSVPSGSYSCTQGAQVYLLATQGNPGLNPASSNNPYIGLMAGLGACPASGTFASAVPHLTLDEVSTVVTAYALAGYFTDAEHLSTGTSALATTGLNNAAANIATMENIVNGGAYSTTPNGKGTVPQATINLLANILAQCNNSPGTFCTSSLFPITMNGSTTPSDSATAAIFIAKNPGANVNALWKLVTSSGPFQPAAMTQPNDFSLTIHFTPATALFSTSGKGGFIAIDAGGDVWGPGANSASAVELSPLGALLHTISFTASSNGQYFPLNISISPAGTIWEANYAAGYALPTASTFTAVSDSAASWAGSELAVAFDTSNDAWAANNYPASFGEFGSSGALIPASDSGYEPSGIAPLTSPNTTYPNQLLAVAVDSGNNVWGVCNHCSGTATSGSGLSADAAEITHSGIAVSPTGGDKPASIVYPSAVAIDSSNNAWISDFNGYVTEYSSTNTLKSGSGFPASGQLGSLNDLAIDGGNTVWIVQSNAATGTGVLYSMNSSGVLTSPSGGYQAPLPSGVYYNDNSLAIDPSGNIWILDYSGGLHEVIGIATPVTTPITASALATKP